MRWTRKHCVALGASILVWATCLVAQVLHAGDGAPAWLALFAVPATSNIASVGIVVLAVFKCSAPSGILWDIAEATGRRKEREAIERERGNVVPMQRAGVN